MEQRPDRREAAPQLDRRLQQQLRWLRLRLVARALLILFAGLGLLFSASALALPGMEWFGEPAAVSLRLVMLGAVLWVGIVELWLPLRRVRGLEEFAAEVERHGAWGNVLSAATQFRLHGAPEGGSSALVDEVLRRAAATSATEPLARRVPLPGLLTHFSFALVALLLFLWVNARAPERVGRSFSLLVHAGSLVEPPHETGIYSLTGDLRVPVGDAVRLEATDFTGLEDLPVLEVDRTGGLWQRVDLDEVVDAGSSRLLKVEVQDVVNPFRYRFRRGTVVSEPHNVWIHERPVVTGVRMELVPPAYSGREARELVDPAGTVTTLAGTHIRLTGDASAALSQARRHVARPDSVVAMQVEGKAFADSFTVLADQEFRIELVDAEGFAGEALTVYRILAEPDLPPSVEILEPAEDRPLERDLLLRISGVAADDVGLARLDLVWREDSSTTWEHIPLLGDGSPGIGELRVDRGESEVGVEFVWDLGEIDLLPGDGLSYALEATDNNLRKGGQTTRSRSWQLRLPTIAELFENDSVDRTESDDELRDLLTEGEDLRQDLERLHRELLKEPDPEWQKREEIRETLKRQQELQQKLGEAADEMRAQIEDFEQENSGNLEMLDKMEMIQDLMQELKDDESLQAWLEAMEEAMEDLSPMEIQRQMEDSLARQEEFNRRLDRTIELLKELDRERRMSDMVEETNEFLQRQRELAELTEPEEPPASENRNGEEQDPGESAEQDVNKGEETPPDKPADPSQAAPDDEELARMQDRLREQTEQLEKQLREELDQLAEEKAGEEKQSPSAEEMKKALEDVMEQMKEQKPSESMDDATGDLEKGDRSEAREQQDEAREQLLKLYEILMQGQAAMVKSSGKYAGDKLQRAAFDLLQLSYRQEVVSTALRDGVRGQNMRPLTREQSRISRATRKLNNDLEELARDNFNIPERLLGSLRALAELSEATGEELGTGRAVRSREGATDVMGDMNQLVTALLSAASNANGGGGGSSPMPSPSEQMRQMAEEQGRLNGMTQEMRQRMEQGLSPEERRQLAEMQARQQAIREQLSQLHDQLEDERRVLGDLDDLAESMEEVEKGLGQGQIDDSLEDQQENILSRLLDAERSIRERDFAQRRESREGERIFADQEGETGVIGDEGREDMLRRFTAPERAPEAWRDEVRRYFRSLQRELDAKHGGGQ